MKTLITLLIFCLMFNMISTDILLSSERDQDTSQQWWSIPHPDKFNIDKIHTKLSFIRVEGNKFVDENGDRMIFMGVNISDPDKIQKNGRWSKEHFEVIKQ